MDLSAEDVRIFFASIKVCQFCFNTEEVYQYGSIYICDRCIPF